MGKIILLIIIIAANVWLWNNHEVLKSDILTQKSLLAAIVVALDIFGTIFIVVFHWNQKISLWK